MKKYILCFLLICYASVSFAANNFVSEDIKINFRTGPSIKYRVSGSIPSGQKITIIDATSSRYFYKIKTMGGKTGWLSRKMIKSGISVREENKNLVQTLSTNVTLIQQQADEILRLKSLLDSQKVKSDQQTSKQSQLTTKISSLNSQLNKLDDSNLIRWITHIGIVLVFGGFLLAILSIFRRRKDYNEIY